jgi:hypothetical protein
MIDRDERGRVNTVVEKVKAAVDPNTPLVELRCRLTLKMKLIVNRGVSGVSRSHGGEKRYDKNTAIAM